MCIDFVTPGYYKIKTISEYIRILGIKWNEKYKQEEEVVEVKEELLIVTNKLITSFLKRKNISPHIRGELELMKSKINEIRNKRP